MESITWKSKNLLVSIISKTKEFVYFYLIIQEKKLCQTTSEIDVDGYGCGR